MEIYYRSNIFFFPKQIYIVETATGYYYTLNQCLYYAAIVSFMQNYLTTTKNQLNKIYVRVYVCVYTYMYT